MKYILIADDDSLNQAIYTELLEETYELAHVENGEICIKSIEQRTPDILLLDYSMPKMNGIEVCNFLRQDERFKNLPVIMVTGHATSTVENECMQTGATAYFAKPFVLSELVDKIGELCDK